jgi:hypothetical protein
MSDQLAKLNLELAKASLPDYVRALKGPTFSFRGQEFTGWGVYQDVLCLWARIDELTAGTKVNRLALGETLRQLRDIYSDRNIGGNRRTSGHGTFEKECQQRGYKPRTVRDLISDYEAFLLGQPSAAEKRKTREQRTPTQCLMQAVRRIAEIAQDPKALEQLSPEELAKCEVSVKVLTNVIARAKESSCQKWTSLAGGVEQHV